MAVRVGCFEWTETTELQAWCLYQDDCSWQDIADVLGCSAGAARTRVEQLRARMTRGETKGGMRCSPEQIADRERRQEARYALPDATALMGDPPPGFSALEGKVGMVVPRYAPNERGKYTRGGGW